MQRDPRDPRLGQREKLTRLGDSVMVLVHPAAEFGIAGEGACYPAVPVAAVFRKVVNRQGQETVTLSAARGRRLRCNVAKQLRAVVDHSISIPVEREEARL